MGAMIPMFDSKPCPWRGSTGPKSVERKGERASRIVCSVCSACGPLAFEKEGCLPMEHNMAVLAVAAWDRMAKE